MNLDELQAEAEQFFEWPGDKKDYTTLISALLFARRMMLKERERCALICDKHSRDYTREGAEVCAAEIRARLGE